MGIMDWKHWLVILAVVILVFGTKKLKGLGSDVGETIKGFRATMREDEQVVVPPAQTLPQTSSTSTGNPTGVNSAGLAPTRPDTNSPLN